MNGTGMEFQAQEAPPTGLFGGAAPQAQELPPEQGGGYQVQMEVAETDPNLGQAQDDPEPTFDIEADRAAGIDVDHPLYQRMLSMQENAFGQTGLDVAAAEIESEAMFGQSEPAQPALEIAPLAVDWTGFNPPAIDENDPLAEHADTISRIVREHVGYVLKSVNAQTQQQAQQASFNSTRNYLTQVVDAIGAEAGPAKKREALSLLARYKDVAIRDPKRWATDAVKILGIKPKGAPQSQPQAQAPRFAPQRTMQQVRGQGRRPSAPSSAAARTQVFESTEAAVRAALEAQMRNQRGR